MTIEEWDFLMAHPWVLGYLLLIGFLTGAIIALCVVRLFVRQFVGRVLDEAVIPEVNKACVKQFGRPLNWDAPQ